MGPALGNMDVCPSGSAASEEIEYEAPQGELEEAIARVWQEAFKLEKIGRNDNFFWLGGNSLLGMDLSEKLTYRLELEISVLTIYQYPTVREMADLIQLSR